MCSRQGIAIFVMLASCAPALSADRFAGFDAYVNAAMKEWQVPGASVAIVKDGKVVLARGFGVRKVGERPIVDGNTIFPLGSITKNFTATALALLVEERKLKWDDPVTKHLPDLKFADDYRTKHLTIRDLLCHRTGLERGDLLPRRGDVSGKDVLYRIRFLQAVSGFRAKWGYNNLMYYVAGAVVGKLTDSTWEQAVAERLLKPLKMKSTATMAKRIGTDNRSHPHRLLGGKVKPAEPAGWKRHPSPAGSMHSNATDMAKWLLAAIADDGTDGLLKQATRREMQSIQMSIPATWDRKGNPYAARFYGWGLGWTVLDYRGRKVCYHAGSSGTMFAVVPEEKIGVVVLTNQEWTNLAGMLMYDVLDTFLVGPTKAWDRKKWGFWKKADPHPDEGRKRDLKKAELKRKPTIRPTLNPEELAGQYECDLYGDIIVAVHDGSLTFKYGRNKSTTGSHWAADTYYVQRPVGDDASVDWLVTFHSKGERATSLTIQRLGWHEALPRFVRKVEKTGNQE